jgi:hypothetical protein
MTPNVDTRRGPTCEPEPSATAPAVVAVPAGVGQNPADPAHDELVLLAQLASTNTRIAKYIARVLDVDRGRTEFTTTLVEVERRLGADLLAIGQSLLSHAERPHGIEHRHCVTAPVEPDLSPGRDLP